MTRLPAGNPTRLNVSVLSRYFSDGDVVPNRVEQVSLPHIRRCLAGGLAVVSEDRATLALTAEGRAAVARFLGVEVARG